MYVVKATSGLLVHLSWRKGSGLRTIDLPWRRCATGSQAVNIRAQKTILRKSNSLPTAKMSAWPIGTGNCAGNELLAVSRESSSLISTSNPQSSM